MEDLGIRGFHERFAEALRLRLYPNTTVHLKQLAAGIGRSAGEIVEAIAGAADRQSLVRRQ